MRYYIEDVKVGIGEGGMACGPVSGPIVCEVTLRDEDGELEYHDLLEIEGCPHFYTSMESCYEDLLAEEEDMIDELVNAGDGFCDYNEAFEDLESEDEDTVMIWRYLIYMVRADWDEVEALKKVSVGKYLDKIVIPASDVEEEYYEE